jgi:pyrimidine deaminase RibD-like protein
MEPKRDRELMERTVDLSRKSISETDGRNHPLVGAVIATSEGHIIAEGFRGQSTPGNHAEQEALLTVNRNDVVSGAVVYSTLEPCTVRGKQEPCCSRLLERSIAEVVIGILDPNPDIRGRGWWKFEERGVKVRNFDYDLVKVIRELNRDFIEYQHGLGILITEIIPTGCDPISVEPDHRTGKKVLTVANEHIAIRGRYNIHPSRGDQLTLFVRRNGRYYPQMPINFDLDKENRTWQCPRAYISGKLKVEGATQAQDPINEIIIARLSDDLIPLVRHYGTVHHETRKWIGIDMKPQPPGLEVLASIIVKVV